MEESLLAAFSSDLKVSSERNDPAAPHPSPFRLDNRSIALHLDRIPFYRFIEYLIARLCQYKTKTDINDGQEYRRIQMFERQKKKRFDALNYARKLAEGELTSDEIDDLMEVSEEEKQQKKRFNPFKNQLMLSEWLVEVPVDMENEWLMTVCPIGKRCLVVANRGSTSVYTKSGYRINRFPSLLPGGCRRTIKPGEYTILDCIYAEVERKFYVIDLTCWKGHPVYDSETEFRFFWLKTKFQEEKDLETRSRINPYTFALAPCSGCKVSEIQAAITENYPFKVDGLLFYHKRVHYTPGRTPLVGWLKPFMIPEVFGISLPASIADHAQPLNKLTLQNNSCSSNGLYSPEGHKQRPENNESVEME